MELFAFIILLYIVGNVVFHTLKIGISPMFSSTKVIQFFLKNINLYNKNTIVDLGSGWGIFALVVAKNFPDKKVVGYELSPFPFYFSKLLAFLFQTKNLYFYKKDFLKEDFDTDSFYFTYLYTKGMQKLEEKIILDNQKLLLISSTFALHTIKASKKEILDDIFKTPIYIYNL
jgi:16S rRNA A1518/A1519 N6-dimethyltransferase RsmA/KsgA/DIM1 with predicted DNA glycosylase/AP lyase activity